MRRLVLAWVVALFIVLSVGSRDVAMSETRNPFSE